MVAKTTFANTLSLKIGQFLSSPFRCYFKQIIKQINCKHSSKRIYHQLHGTPSTGQPPEFFNHLNAKNYSFNIQILNMEGHFFSEAFLNEQTRLKSLQFDASKILNKTKPSYQKQDSDSFQPEYHQIKKLGLVINKNKLTIGAWTAQENAIYLDFLLSNRSDFQNESNRRKTKVFYRLSKILKKRTPDQCRSHHQKLQLKFNSDLDEIIEEIKYKIKKGLSLAEEEQCDEPPQQQNKETVTKHKFGINQIKTGLAQNASNIEECANSQQGWFFSSIHQKYLLVGVNWHSVMYWQ